MPRQTMTARPNAARMAPTAMKTVPSGRVEWFMKGACCVSGTAGGGYVGMGAAPGRLSEGRSLMAATVLGCPRGGRERGVVRAVVRAVVLRVTRLDDDDTAAEVLLVVAAVVGAVVGCVVACASTSLENRERAAKADRSSERFNESCDDAIVDGDVTAKRGEFAFVGLLICRPPAVRRALQRQRESPRRDCTDTSTAFAGVGGRGVVKRGW